MSERRSAIQDELRQSRPFQSKRQEVFLALLRTGAVVKRPVSKVVEEMGVSLAQYNVLRILRGASDAGLPTLAIRERMIEEAAGITRLIDKLEAAEFVRRDRSASPDRRQVYCQITASGLDLLERLDPEVIEAIEAALSVLNGPGLDQLLELLDEIREGSKIVSRQSATQEAVADRSS